MDALSDQYPLDVVWRSFELRPAGSPPISPAYRERIEAARPRFAAAMYDELGVTIHSGPFGINSRLSLIGAKVAEAAGAAKAYQDGVFKAYWQKGQDIGDEAVLIDIAAAAGIDRDAFKAGLDDEKFLNAVLADIDRAYEFGISAVPAMVFSEKYLVVGAQPTPILAGAVEKVIELESDAAG